jgi:hypothetical protein
MVRAWEKVKGMGYGMLDKRKRRKRGKGRGKKGKEEG